MHIKALSHLADVARWCYTGAQICRFFGICTFFFFNIFKIFCRCAAGASNGSTLVYDFINVVRAPVAPRNGSAALRWPQ